mmetsp:Transcript_22598/g.31494  ORF Transcript_22598/g.31494 Transcript_22598/m.31494 type:complete len:83 (-) Transcript_22598:169-417(-)
MLPERTTTTGDSEPVSSMRTFQIIRAELTIIPKLIPDSMYSLFFIVRRECRVSDITWGAIFVLSKKFKNNGKVPLVDGCPEL